MPAKQQIHATAWNSKIEDINILQDDESGTNATSHTLRQATVYCILSAASLAGSCSAAPKTCSASCKTCKQATQNFTQLDSHQKDIVNTLLAGPIVLHVTLTYQQTAGPVSSTL